MKSRALFLLLVFVLPLIAMALLPNPVLAAPGEAEIELDPDSGGIDTRVQVKGRHFDDYEGRDIVLYFSSDKADVGDDLKKLKDWEWLRTAEVDDGKFTTYFDVPLKIDDKGDEDVEDEEDYYVYAVAKGESVTLARAEFEVTKKRELQLDPKQGVVGEKVDISGWGFARRGWVRIFYDVTLMGVYSLDREGEFTIAFKVPESTAGGHRVVIEDNEKNWADDVFWVQPDLTISPDIVPVDSPLGINGTGFGKEAKVTIRHGNDKIEVTTNAMGSFFFPMRTTEGPAGSFTVTAEDSYGNRATATFTIIPTITAPPIQGTVGSEIEVKGTGFAANQGVTISYDGGRITTAQPIATDFKGSFTATLVVPPSSGGKHSLSAVDAAGNRHTATFTVLPSLRLHPGQGAVGTPLELEGTGFTIGSSLTITYDDTVLDLPTSPTADSQGSFAIAFPAPKSPGGKHTITVAADDVNNTTLSVSFHMEQTPPPPPQLKSPAPDQRLGWFTSATPEFDWADVSDPSGVSYTLEIAYSPNSANPILTKAGLSESQYRLERAEALPRGSYYWRVKAIDGAGNEGAWSTASPFKVGWLPLWLFIILVLVALVIVGGVALVVIILRL